MEQTPKNDTETSFPHPSGIAANSTIFYGIMASIGAMISWFVHKNLVSIFSYQQLKVNHEFMIGFTVLGLGVLLVFGYLFEQYFKSFQELKESFRSLFGACSAPVVIYLAAVSSIGEELFFRGAIQPYLGLLGTSFVFGFLHLGPGLRFSTWTVWAIGAGLLFGWMFDVTGSLWPSIFCHFVVNLISIFRLRNDYRKSLLEKEKA